ncbi:MULTISPECIES: RhuM family protein [unclassified Corynebacterium]|uniref:RhuM family protein n=1 Tax=unclassified Corynebacterium TaxID=2624378 RepID=UPI0029CA3BD5|nr:MULTISPECIES: RhuM family protein [unclassified Corynebacterium]WPF65220.1 RhuM family protein [Corynebacterium sp. 22KM0430]WPF67715.1 RhuM family protein [Corynebacterium sp. 21KM1197]
MDKPDEVIIYNTNDGLAKVALQVKNGQAWLTQKQMANLFSTSPATISKHLSNAYNEGEISREATVSKMEKVRSEQGRSVTRRLDHYNLEAILAVGYRVKGERGIQFRKWATTILSEYLHRGFALDDQRLKNDGANTHFDELLERIRDIRASEKQFFRKICDVIATSSQDYNGSYPEVQRYFANLQNKIHHAVHGHTAAELLLERANAALPYMGMTNWSGENGPRHQDVYIAKNYLTDSELKEANRLVTMYLDYAEDRASKRQGMILADWVQLTDRWLEFNEREVLEGAGKRSAQQAKNHAKEQWRLYQQRHDEEVNEVDMQELENQVKELRSKRV